MSASFTFKTPEACVGDAAIAQFVMTSTAQKDSAPVVWSSVKITFEGSIITIVLTHDRSTDLQPPDERSVRLIDIKGKLNDQILDPKEPPPSPTSPKTFLKASTDLSIYPGETKVIELSILLREAGEAKVMAATLEITTPEYEFEYLVVLENENEGWTDELGIGKSIGAGSRRRGRGEITVSGGNSAWWVRDQKAVLRKKPVRSEEPATLR